MQNVLRVAVSVCISQARAAIGSIKVWIIIGRRWALAIHRWSRCWSRCWCQRGLSRAYCGGERQKDWHILNCIHGRALQLGTHTCTISARAVHSLKHLLTGELCIFSCSPFAAIYWRGSATVHLLFRDLISFVWKVPWCRRLAELVVMPMCIPRSAVVREQKKQARRRAKLLDNK